MQGKRQMVVRVWLLRVCAEHGKLETGSSVCVPLHCPYPFVALCKNRFLNSTSGYVQIPNPLQNKYGVEIV